MGEVRAEYVVLRVPGERVPTGGAGSSGLHCVRGAGGIGGTWVVVTPSETQALLVAGAVRQGGRTGMD